MTLSLSLATKGRGTCASVSFRAVPPLSRFEVLLERRREGRRANTAITTTTTGVACRASSISDVSTEISTGQCTVLFEDVVVKTQVGIALYDITNQVESVLAKSGVKNGVANVISRHTTTALTINELEPRLVDDVRQFLSRLVPSDYPYLHNDMQYR